MKKTILLLPVLLLAASLFAEVEVKSVKGLVGVKTGTKLAPVKAGQFLSEDATVVTGANSEVVLVVNNGLITLKSLTTAKLRGVALTKAASTADVALRNGTVVSEVKQITGLKTSFTVTTPVGTSSVRGTTHSVTYSPELGLRVSVASGTVSVSSLRGATRPVAAGLSYADGAGAAPPSVAPQAAADAVAAAATAETAFATPEEAALAAETGGGAEPGSDLVDQLGGQSDAGTVRIYLLFP